MDGCWDVMDVCGDVMGECWDEMEDARFCQANCKTVARNTSIFL